METDEDAQSVSKQVRYQRGLDSKNLVSARVTIPKHSVAELRRWAKLERQELKEEQDDIPCVDDERENPHKKNP